MTIVRTSSAGRESVGFPICAWTSALNTWPLPVSTLQPGRLQSLGEFWQALGGKPKAALNYTVTLPVDVSEPETQPLVIDKEIRMRLDTRARS